MSSKASKYLNEILDSATNGQTNENSAAGESLLLTSLFSPANILASSVVAKPVMTSALTKPLQTTSVAPYLAQTYQPVVVKSWQTAVYSASIGTATTVKPYQPKYKHLNEIDRVPIYRTKYKQSSGLFLDTKFNNKYLFASVKVTEPIKPALLEPLRAGGYLIWPEANKRHLYFLLEKPQTGDFSLTIQNEEINDTIKTTRGNAVLKIGLYASNSVEQLENLLSSGNEALKPYSKWKFVPLNLSGLKAEFSPTSNTEIHRAAATMSAETGMVIFLIDLKEAGAINWKSNIEQGLGYQLNGLISLEATFIVSDSKGLPQTRSWHLTETLGALLQGVPKEVNIIQPQVSLNTRVIVSASPLLHLVTADVRPPTGYLPQSFSFDENGGDWSCRLTGVNLEDLQVELHKKVQFKATGWPVLSNKKSLNYANTEWTEIVDINSWLDKFSLSVVVVDRNNQIVKHDEDQIVCTMSYSAGFLEEGKPIISIIAVKSGDFQEISFPLPQGSVPGQLKLNIIASLVVEGKKIVPKVITKNIASSASAIIVSIAQDDKPIEVVTNEDPVPESSIQQHMLDLMTQ
jgi:hypothetical protein